MSFCNKGVQIQAVSNVIGGDLSMHYGRGRGKFSFDEY